MKAEKLARLKHLDELSYRGFLTDSEEAERSALRSQLQEEERLKSVKQERNTQDTVSGEQSSSEVSQEVSGGLRPTFREAMSMAGKQIDIDGFYQRGVDGGWVQGPDYMLARTLCMVMAEIYMAAPRYVFFVGGIAMEAAQIREVYGELTSRHIEAVSRKIRQSKGKTVKYQRPYLRTMLYNVVFEYEAQTQGGMDVTAWDT